MSRGPLNEVELAEALAALPTWSVVNGELATTRKLPTFLEAIAFVEKVAQVAEELDHHPDIDIRWRTVHLHVSTHDAGNAITGADVKLAHRIDALG